MAFGAQGDPVIADHLASGTHDDEAPLPRALLHHEQAPGTIPASLSPDNLLEKHRPLRCWHHPFRQRYRPFRQRHPRFGHDCGSVPSRQRCGIRPDHGVEVFRVTTRKEPLAHLRHSCSKVIGHGGRFGRAAVQRPGRAVPDDARRRNAHERRFATPAGGAQGNQRHAQGPSSPSHVHASLRSVRRTRSPGGSAPHAKAKMRCPRRVKRSTACLPIRRDSRSLHSDP